MRVPFTSHPQRPAGHDASSGSWKRRSLQNGQSGAMMLEALISIAIIGAAGSAVLLGLSTMHRSGATTAELATADNIARNQMEYVFASPYLAPPATYASIATPPSYAVTAVAEVYSEGDPTIEKVIVTVTRGPRELITFETVRSE